MSLDNAPDDVKLAVDLIMLLEQHDIPTQTVLSALEIVREDFCVSCGKNRLPANAVHLNR